MADDQLEGKIIPVSDVKAFVERCMVAAGSKSDHAEVLAELLVKADYRGHFSHGLNRLDMYVFDIESGTTVSDAEPEILSETPACAWVDGKNILGPVVGRFCTDLAVKKAKDMGIGWVVAKGSNHFGIAGWYSLRAMEHGMIGMAFTNTSPLVVPTRSKQATLGTNPLTVAAPGKEGDSFVLDMATSTAALGKVEFCDRKNTDVPNGWAVDSKGHQTNSPKEMLADGGLMPLGGSEECGGYKGYGLGMMVEVFCGLLAGSQFGPNIRKWRSTHALANLGQCFVAINPAMFAPGFEDRMQSLIDHCRNLDMAEGEDKPVLVPGDPERQHIDKCDKQGGIMYHPNLVQHMEGLAKRLGVSPMKAIN
ncbi:putative oxidoreductase YjmC [Tubulanus polymorphus]|uniref:putative oxidoreductase YjmC n=1 Tax=Tubulanus polymorphus TaxID=672921 RepID=UPI003DA37491